MTIKDDIIKTLTDYRDEIRDRLESYIESGDAILVAQWGGKLNAIENALARIQFILDRE